MHTVVLKLKERNLMEKENIFILKYKTKIFKNEKYKCAFGFIISNYSLNGMRKICEYLFLSKNASKSMKYVKYSRTQITPINTV